MRVANRSAVCAMVGLISTASCLIAQDVGAQETFSLFAIHETADTFDDEIGRGFMAAAGSHVCASGQAHERFARAAAACRAAYDYAYEMRQLDVAARYAKTACHKHRDESACKFVAQLAKRPATTTRVTASAKAGERVVR